MTEAPKKPEMPKVKTEKEVVEDAIKETEGAMARSAETAKMMALNKEINTVALKYLTTKLKEA